MVEVKGIRELYCLFNGDFEGITNIKVIRMESDVFHLYFFKDGIEYFIYLCDDEIPECEYNKNGE